MTNTAADRAQDFLDHKALMGGVDQVDVHSVWVLGGEHRLTTADIRTLIDQSRALQQSAPEAARLIEESHRVEE